MEDHVIICSQVFQTNEIVQSNLAKESRNLKPIYVAILVDI